MLLSRNSGILAAYIVGAFVEYEYVPSVFVIIPVVYLICFILLPNTPQYYIQKNNVEVRIPSPNLFQTIDQF